MTEPKRSKVSIYDELIAERRKNDELLETIEYLTGQVRQLAQLNDLLQKRVAAQVRHNGAMQ